MVLVLMRYSMESLVMERFTISISSFFLALILATFMGCAATSPREGAGEYVGDAAITTKVKAAIFDDPSQVRANVMAGANTPA